MFADTECTISTTGYREYSSIITSRYSPVDSGVHQSPYLGFALAFLASVTFSMVPCVSVKRVLLDKRSMLSQCFKPFRLYAGTTVLIVLTNLLFRLLDDLRVRFRQPCFAVLSVELSEFHVVVRRRVLQ